MTGLFLLKTFFFFIFLKASVGPLYFRNDKIINSQLFTIFCQTLIFCWTIKSYFRTYYSKKNFKIWPQVKCGSTTHYEKTVLRPRFLRPCYKTRPNTCDYRPGQSKATLIEPQPKTRSYSRSSKSGPNT